MKTTGEQVIAPTCLGSDDSNFPLGKAIRP